MTFSPEALAAEQPRRFRPYPAYGACGPTWLRELPAHWRIRRLKHCLARMQAGGTPDTGVEGFWSKDGDGTPWVSIGDMTRAGRTILVTEKTVTENGLAYKRLSVLPAGTLIYSIYASLGKVSELGIPAAFNQAILALIPAAELDRNFLRWWLEFSAEGLLEVSSSNTQDNLNAQKVKNLPLACPPLDEQQAIADFLDRETAKIDTLVARKERLIELLQEKRAALITRAVTKGLDRYAPLRDSGIEWLGEVPAHWEVTRNRALFAQIDERSEDGTEELLTVSHLTGVTPRAEKDVTMFMAESRAGYKVCRAGQLAVNTMWAWMGALGVSSYDGIVSPSYHVYRFLTRRLLPTYFDLLCRTDSYEVQIGQYSKGVWTSRLRLYPEEFMQMVSPVPPVDEQERVTKRIQELDEEAGPLLANLEVSIQNLREYRAALITAAVTGRIDVRNEVA